MWSLYNIKSNVEYKIIQTEFVGRNREALIHALDPSVSRMHAKLTLTPENLLQVQDLKSCNGTYINSEKIKPMDLILLNVGDIIAFGNIDDKIRVTTPLMFKVLQNEQVVCKKDKNDMNEDKKIIKNKIEEKKSCSDEISTTNSENGNETDKTEPITKENNEAMCSKREKTPEKPSNSQKSNILDEFIVISDDDDDDIFTSSQLVKLDIQIKKEQEEGVNIDEEFLHIKQELEFMDEIEIEEEKEGEKVVVINKVPINLEDEFNDTSELCNFLDDSIQQSQLNPHNNIINKQNSKEKEKQVNGHKEKPTKFLKPPIVEPHHIVPNRRIAKTKEKTNTRSSNGEKPTTSVSNIKEISNNMNKITIKRKAEEKKEDKQPSKAKRAKRSEDPRLNQSNIDKNIEIKIINEKEKLIQEQRRRKLKDFYETHKIPSKIPTSNHIESIPGPSKVTPNQIILKEKPSENPVLMNNLMIYPKTANPPVYDYRDISIESVYKKITNWKVKWFEEQKNCSHSPPINGNFEHRNMLLSFHTYNEYYTTLGLLAYLELWQQLYDSLFKNEQSKTTPAQIIHTRIVNELVYIDCICYGDEEMNKKNYCIFQNECGLLEIKFSNKNNEMFQFTGLTIVTDFKKSFLRHDSTIYDAVAIFMKNKPFVEYKFTLVTKYIPDAIISNTLVMLKLFTTLTSNFNQFKTIKYLRYNERLMSQILKPKVEDYRLNEFKLNLKPANVRLNAKQFQIVREACEFAVGEKKGFYLIKGPPGTGKSTVIVNMIFELILNLISPNCQILLVAPSNAAVDTLVGKIIEAREPLSAADKKRIRLVRVGPKLAISRESQKVTVNTLALQNLAVKYTKFHHMPEYREAERKNDLYHFFRKHLGSSFSYELRNCEDQILFNANIIATTLNSSISNRYVSAVKNKKLNFLCCIVDEATQANELETLQPIVLGLEKFILVGDPQQLSATVLNKDAKQLGYGKSLFTRISENFDLVPEEQNPIRMLVEQYRMDAEICSFPSRRFYNNKLITVKNDRNKIVPHIQPYLVFNIRNETINSDCYLNQIEVNFLRFLLDLICRRIDEKCQFSIGIITPYSTQRDAIGRELKTIDSLRKSNISYTVNTVDSFQGQENDIILISCVRIATNDFLKNENRLNVALTRAKQALYVIGSYNLFKHTSILYDLREDAKIRKLCIDIADLDQNLKNHLNRTLFL